MPRRHPGKLVAVEGIDGSGKTTQAYLLVEALRAKGLKAEYTSEPTFGRVGDLLRLHVLDAKKREPHYEALLFAADRLEHVNATIRPGLNRGAIVVSDRYLYSSLAYQGAAGVDLAWIKAINFFAPKPDLTIYLDIEPAEALRRKGGLPSRFERQANLRGVRRLFLEMADSEGFVVVGASGSVEEVRRRVWAAVEEKLRLP